MGDRYRVTHTGVDVLDLQVWIQVMDDPIERNALVDQLGDVLDSDSGPGHMRLAEVNLGAHGDSVDHGWRSQRLLR
jgi:hypothetical protein